MRPMVRVALVQEYTYAYGTISPVDGTLDWILAPKMDTVTMGAFLKHVSNRHPDEFILMVLDGAPCHRANHLCVPDRMSLVRLPAYSPELNPVEHLWDEMREKDFANRVFDSLGSAMAQAARGLKRLENSPHSVKRLAGWPWILRSF